MKTNWKAKAEHWEKEATKKSAEVISLQMRVDDLVRKYNEWAINHKCQKPKWYSESLWYDVFALCCAGVLSFICGLTIGSKMVIPVAPRETIRYVIKGEPEKAAEVYALRREVATLKRRLKDFQP